MALPRMLVLCTVSTGLDAVAEVLRSGYKIEAIVGVAPCVADPDVISGYVDVAMFAAKWNIPHIYVTRYDLQSEADRDRLSACSFDLIWVSGWQRLIPDWLIDKASMGALGGHGSPDGIHGGRGRSPQNWAIMLGCKRFDLAMFRISSGIDDGPVVAQSSFFYNETDDISISYKKAGLCMGEMILKVLNNPALLLSAVPQPGKAYYYPQRKPEDGYADWDLSQREIWAFCRALTRPYPGLRTRQNESEIVIWNCVPFDDAVRTEPGTIDFVFEDGSFLVSCKDGRVLVREYFTANGWAPFANMKLASVAVEETINRIAVRHRAKFPALPIAKRIANGICNEK